VSYSRKIFLINPKFQYGLSFYASALVFVTGLIYPFTIYVLLSAISANFALTNPDIANYYTDKRDLLIFLLSGLHIGFVVLTFFGCIFFSHKIAGPLYKLQKHLRTIREGLSPGKLFFRKGDYFQDVADDLNDTIEHIEEGYKNDLVYLSEVNSYINNLGLVVPDDKRVILNEISSRLSDIQEKFTKKS
jgi:hypothetical protein